MVMFQLTARFSPTGDQPNAISGLVRGIHEGRKNQVLLGVTGSGKTFTIANVITKLNMPALVISHNKTLAGQLYQEMRDFFPNNAVSYFVSYYDYYQPEAYVPQTDTYIEKEAEVNELIDKLRLQSTTNILTRTDTIVVASVSCIYNIGSPQEYGRNIVHIKVGGSADWLSIGKQLIELQYERSEFEFKRGTYRVRGSYMDIYPAYEDIGYRVSESGGVVRSIVSFDPVSGSEHPTQNIPSITLYPAKHYMMDRSVLESGEAQIRRDVAVESKALEREGKIVEAQRLMRKVTYDLELIKEVGYVNGIENYSRYFDGRRPGDPPYSLLDYFRHAYGDNFLTIIDESHMTVPQLRGMYNGDHARKKTLIDFGFRLQAAYDNRPLKFEEFYKIPPHLIYVSATPNEWETEQSKVESPALARASAGKRKSKVANPSLREAKRRSNPDNSESPSHVQSANYNGIVEQLIRPTGIVDPQIIVRPAKNEVEDLIKEIESRVQSRKSKGKKTEKILVTTLTKKTAEDLSQYLLEKKIRASYLHSDIHTLERSDVLDNLRKNEYDVLIGVNLLREGLDLPEVTLVAILDADREGFLRSRTSLIQTMGRAARNVDSVVILYADTITRSMQLAMDEINRRREYQLEYNKQHGIVPKTIMKPVREKIIEGTEEFLMYDRAKEEVDERFLTHLKPSGMTAYDKKKIIKKLEREMKRQAEELHFERAIAIRDKIRELKES